MAIGFTLSAEQIRSQQIGPDEYTSKIRLAEAYEESRDFVDAVRLYSDLHAANPNDPTVFEGLTRGLLFLKRYDEAERIVQVKMKTDRSLDVLLLYARLEARLNKRPDALDAFKEAETASHARDCSQLFPIVYAMIDVSYNQDALALLDRMRSLGGDDVDLCTSQIAGLYLRLGDQARASQEFIAMLKSGDGNVLTIEQRLAGYMTDSTSRNTVLGALEKDLSKIDQTQPVLRLLAWLYGEEKNYAKALDVIIKLDSLGDKNSQNNQGFELLQFADRARNEGALDVAVRAYDEALRRLKTVDNSRQNYFISQAELGALKTRELYLTTRSDASGSSVPDLVTRYEQYAEHAPQELAIDALLHAGDLAFHQLFALDRATKDYEAALARSHGLSEKARDAAFDLVDIAYASENFQLAQVRMNAIDRIVVEGRNGNSRDTRDHLLYEEALGEYYQGRFDSAMTLLAEVSNDVSSDYANDAIQLSGLLEENNNTTGLSALQLYAKASLAAVAHKYNDARSEFQTIVETMPNAPLADDANLRVAEMYVKLGRPEDAVHSLDMMQDKMLTSPLLDQAAFREAEIVEKNLHDKARAEKLYEDFLAHYPTSSFAADARDRARKLRGDAF